MKFIFGGKEVLIPDGWVYVYEGLSKKGDKAWNYFLENFETAGESSPASSFYCLIRQSSRKNHPLTNIFK